MKAENAKQAEEVARKNELAALNATIANKDIELGNMRRQMDEQEKAKDVSRKCIHSLKVRAVVTLIFPWRGFYEGAIGYGGTPKTRSITQIPFRPNLYFSLPVLT